MSFVISGLAARFAAGGALSCVLMGAALAQPGPTPSFSARSTSAPTLAQALEAAWQRAVQARETEGQRLRAMSGRAAASSLSAGSPAVELSHRNDRWQTAAGRQETEVGLAWPLWMPGQRHARSAAVEADVDLAQAAGQAGLLQLAGLVRDAAWGVAAQRSDADMADAQLRALQEVAGDVRRRMKAGDLAHADVLAAEAEVLAAQSAQLAARQRLAVSLAQWTTLTGMAQVPDLSPELVQPVGSGAPQPDVDAHPEARVAALAVERARRQVDVVAATRRDPPELLLRLRQDVPGRGEAAQSSVGLGLRIPLETAARNQPLQAAALSELEVALIVRQRTDERLAAEAATAQAAVQTAAQQADADRQRLALLQERAALIDRSFKAGETPLPELLRALAAASQARVSLAGQQVALGLAHARLQQALGFLP